jgi:thiaminase
MFRVTQNPSSGSYIQYVAKITNNGSIVQVITGVVSVMAAYSDS